MSPEIQRFICEFTFAPIISSLFFASSRIGSRLKAGDRAATASRGNGGNSMRILAIGIVLFLAAGSALAQVIVDGTRDVGYGAPRAVQAVQTQFGDAAPPGALGGSELDAAYATIANGRLYLLFTGNHEPNFNKLEVFIDSRAGGENTLSGTPQYDFFNGSTWSSQNMAGLTFDAGFTPDYHLFSRWGSPTGA